MPIDSLLDVQQVARVLKGARTTLSFAFGDGGSAENLLAVDKVKTGEQLFAIIRKHGPGRGFWGTVDCDGSVAVFVSAKPASNQKKLLEDWFRKNKIAIKPQLSEGEPEATPSPKPDPKSVKPESREEGEDEEDVARIFTLPEIKKHLARAKKEPVFFAFGLAKDPADNRLALHPRQPGARLAALIRRDNGATRLSFGTLTMVGTRITFLCEKEPITGLRKMLRALFRGWKLAVKITVIGPEGEVVERGDEEDEDEALEGESLETEDQPDRLETLRSELEALLPLLKQVAAAEPGQADELKSLYRDGQAAVAAGKEAEARRIVERLGGLTGTRPVDGRAAAIRAELDILLPRLKEAARASGDTMLRDQWRAAGELAAAGDLDAAAAILARLEAAAGGVGGEENSDGSALWAETQTELLAALKTVTTRLDALGAELKRQDDDDLSAIARITLPEIASDIENRVASLMKAGVSQAPSLAGVLRRHLSSDERIDAVDRNPYGVKVAVKETLGHALDLLERNLAA